VTATDPSTLSSPPPAAASSPFAATRRSAPAGRRETLAVRIALGLVAVAVLDDAFVHREPGTAMSDHLASGLVPGAVAVLLALVYPRLRPGLRGVVALVCAPLAIVAGIVDGLRHMAIDRLAGDDVTALLALGAGVALAAVGATVLWRSRRLDERPARRYGRRALLAVAALAGLYLVVLPLALAVVVNHKARAPVRPADLGRSQQRISVTTRDGLTLAGWYVPSRNRAAVIAFPGRQGTVRHARMLVGHGYGVVLLDRRGEGESDGDFNARGWGGEPDLEAALDFLGRRPDVDAERIGGLGLSVGGELLLQTAARDGRLRAVVSEGAGRQSLADQMETPDVPAALRWLSPMTIETVAGAVLANRRPPAGLADAMPRIAPRPVMLITGGRGNADEELNAVYRNAGGPTVSLWRIPAAGHTAGISTAPQAYERRVIGFFDRALLGA
jgi:hypothetical protein